jgi:glutathione S-transferase
LKLYYMQGAISLSAHIALREAGIPFELVRVDRPTSTLPDGTKYVQVNPTGLLAGTVPALELEDGRFLNGALAILYHAAEHHPDGTLVPPAGTAAHGRFLEWIAFANCEIKGGGLSMLVRHKAELSPELHAKLVKGLREDFATLDGELAGHSFVMGEHITILDYYLFNLMWAAIVRHGIDLGHLERLQAWFRALGARPAFRAALEAEGLALPA